MENRSKTVDRIVSRVKLRKRATVAFFALILLATLIFLGDYHYYDGLREWGVGLGLHPLIICAVLFAEGITAVAMYSRAENSVERILNDDCDPRLYCDVKRSLLSRSSYVSAITVIDLNVSYYLGDFASCRRFAEDAMRASGDPDKLIGCSFLGMSAFFLGDRRSLEDALKQAKRILERSNIGDRTPLRADFGRRVAILAMLAAALGSDRDEALGYANSLERLGERTSRLERLNTEYLRALVYERAKETKKARACFDECGEIKGKTFINDAVAQHLSAGE